MFVSVIFFIFIRIENTAVQLVLRILLIPVIAGVSYELIRWAGRSEKCIYHSTQQAGAVASEAHDQRTGYGYD